ncbi:MAG: SDR family NAD(P)-dependent oxidoreductase [Rhodothalassiaceae bacterium]
MARLNGKTAVITGASTGIGRATMKLFAAEGAKVFGIARTEARLQSVTAEVADAGGQADFAAADLSDPDQAARAMQTAAETLQRIDILINAAGVGYSYMAVRPGSMNALHDTSTEDWHAVMAINLDSAFYTSRAVIPAMQAQGGGAIVNVASISGFMGLPVAHAYGTSKAGMINLTRSLCVAYAKDGIRANCLCPGLTATPMVESVLPLFDDPAQAEALTPMRRPGTPEEMAHGCLYLASDEASYCNGAVLVIDGGTTARQ